MAESQTAPLTDDERAELEELRALKAQREEEERARRERAELEALRAEREAAESAPAESAASAPEPAAAPKVAPAPAAAPASVATRPAPAPRDEKPVVDPENLTFAQRMVLGDSAQAEEDEIPGMPPAQKIIVILAIACVIGFGIWMFLNR